VRGVFEPRGDLADLIDVHPGVDAHRVEQVEQVFCAEVPGRAGRERAPTDPADGGVEAAHPCFVSGHRVGDAHAAGVVRVERGACCA